MIPSEPRDPRNEVEASHHWHGLAFHAVIAADRLEREMTSVRDPAARRPVPPWAGR